MAQETTFKRGDVVVHIMRPEWGDGIVDQATGIIHENKPAQRVVVKFAHQGRMTLNTAYAQLRPKQVAARPVTAAAMESKTGGGWLGSLGESREGDELTQLPEPMSDPLTGLGSRLKATLDSYRFASESSDLRSHRPPHPRVLVEWAISQTGLVDPLSRYNRHELEEGFHQFAIKREQHLRDLVRNIRRQHRDELIRQAQAGNITPAARAALQRALTF